ncbi:retrovirus-related pol polyprotein from transposon TNT 1-94 [Tanacetum coccineum]
MSLTFQPYSPKDRPGLGIMKRTKPETRDSLDKSVSGTVTVSENEPTTPSVPTKVKNTEQESKINELTKFIQMLINEKILKAKAKPFPPCTHYGFNDHRLGDCRNYPECGICRSYDHYTSGHNHVIHIRGGMLAESSQSSESLICVKCNTCGSTVNSTTEHDKFDHFKRETHQGAHLVPEQWMLTEKCLHLLHMDLFGLVSPMSINHKKYTLVIVDEYSRYTWVYFLRKKSQALEIIMSFIRMVENQNDVKVKQIGTDNRIEYRNHELESFCDKKGISQNFSFPYTPEQNGVAERKNRTLIEAARTMLNDFLLSKHFWTEAVRIAYYTQNRSIIVKRHDKTPYEIFRERISDINYFHVFGCPVFIHNHKDHLGKFDANANAGYFLGYSFVSKAFRVFNRRRQLIEETYHVTFDESMESIRFTHTSDDEIDNQVPKVIASNEPNIPHTEDTKGPPDLINTKGTHEQNVQNDQMITQPTDVPSGKHTEVSGFITESLVLDVTQSHISNQASTSSHHVPQDRWLTRSMAAKLIAVLASECLFPNFLSEIEPKKVSEALKHPGWVDAMKEELNQFYRNKVWTLVPLPYEKTAIGSKWPPGFESSEFPDYVCKLDKSLYGMKQAPRAWMKKESPFVKSCTNLLKKYEFSDSSSVKTPMVPPNNLGPDLTGKPVNETSYRGMIGSLMYLTTTRPDIQFSTVLCARYQSNPKESHLTVVKRILRYLKGTPTLGLYYPKCSVFDLNGYSDSNYVGCNMDRKITSGACQILGGNWFVKVPRNINQWLCPQLKLNMLLLLGVVQDHILKGNIELHFIPTEYQLADIFTKPLDEPTFTRLKAELGMLNID